MITIASLLFVVGGAILVIGSFLILALHRPDNIPFSSVFFLFGYQVGLEGFFVFTLSTGVYSIFQGYGFWKLSAWGWWLYIIFTVIRFLSLLISPQLIHHVLIPTDLLWFILLGYLIWRRNLFNVRLTN